ncbi:hypothetical protein MTR67_029743 [Solanum verrucosum]|uniref:DNA glycosylase superfamily protein n=1 Tax=Solanum verrucosum TaxID=315347 RepID=A0AAF0R827_SOLVR|nr:hypothetical protein MTR67_029743 [Solanum verrucosum]
MFEDLEEGSSRKMSGVSRVKSMNVVDSEARAILVPAVNLVVLLVGRSSSRRNLTVVSDNASDSSLEGLQTKRRCAWLGIHYMRTFKSLYMNIRAESGGSLRFVGLHNSVSYTASLSNQIDLTRFFMTKNGEFRSMMTRDYLNFLFFVELWLNSHGLPSLKEDIFRYLYSYFTVTMGRVKEILQVGLLVCLGDKSYLKWMVEVFADFDPVAVSKLNEKKILAPGSTACSLLSELKLRAVIENARQVSKITAEFGSFDKYIWSFVNQQPILGRFRYPHQVPVKTSKSDVISKDLVRRGFRGVGPTVVYSFMQVAGITNDHLIICFRFQVCLAATEGKQKDLNV